jgi:hypothetical protein
MKSSILHHLCTAELFDLIFASELMTKVLVAYHPELETQKRAAETALQDLKSADGIIIGSSSYCGPMAAEIEQIFGGHRRWQSDHSSLHPADHNPSLTAGKRIYPCKMQ